MAHDNVLTLEGSARVFAHEEHPIGAILVEHGKLKHSDVKRITESQGDLRFGEAARNLGLVSEADLQEALARQYDMPRLVPGSDTASKELVAAYLPHHPRTEQLRGLRTQLLIRWFDPGAGRRVLAVVSPDSGDGRSYLAANLAVVFSQLGLRTLLIDADLRKPRQHKIFRVPDRIGLAAILAGRADSSVAVVPAPGFSKLSLLPAGASPPNPQELLSRPTLAGLLEELDVAFDLVLIDTSASRIYADAKNVAFRAGSALVLARKNHTRVADTRGMLRELNETGTLIAGTVINSF